MLEANAFDEPLFDTPLRTYVLLHTYFKSLLNGVQGAHACTEMSVKYDAGTPQETLYKQWARQDKTLLFLDGGVSLHLHSILGQLQSLDTNAYLPWAHFVEDEATLEGMLTAIAVILPESIAQADPIEWEAAKTSKESPIHADLVKLGVTFNNHQVVLAVIDWIRSRPLAA